MKLAHVLLPAQEMLQHLVANAAFLQKMQEATAYKSLPELQLMYTLATTNEEKEYLRIYMFRGLPENVLGTALDRMQDPTVCN